MLGGENCTHKERKLASAINASPSHDDTEAFSNPRGNSSQEIETTNITIENETLRYGRLLESM